ncbi:MULTISPECIES: tetratricopeptide repeat protein [unclassified Microcoleus]|uniref:tetratricopeptide repeat protein n=1 Tax=unclassified Microcoleus TaxID=2642155 RepID=UPI002FD0BF39
MGIGSPTLHLYEYLRRHEYLSNFKRVIELGSQDIASGQEEIAYLLDALFAFKVDSGTLITAKTLYQSMGFEVYECIDADGIHNALVFDLNKNIQEDHGFSEQFDLVTNHGTTEHCFNQFQCWNNIHNLCSVGGIMIHVLPAQGYVNHGFYNYNPSFFYNLATANNYKLIGLYLSSYKSSDLSAYSLPGLTPYTEKLMKSLCCDAGQPEIGLYAVLQKMTDQTFSMPYDGQYLKVSLLQKNQYLSQQQSGLVIACDFVNEYTKVGNLLASQNNLDGAIEYYLEALKIDPNNAESNFYLGVALEKKGQLGEAIESYQRAVNLKHNYAEAHYNLGKAVFAQREQEGVNKNIDL